MSPAVETEDATREVVRTYDRIAPLYDILDGIYERTWKSRLRRELFEHALPGRLLDAGCGTGCNMAFYPPGAEATGVDSSREMLARARRRADELHLSVRLEPMNLLRLDLPEAHFDTVACTFVLLCLPDRLIPGALAELIRVCRPGGRVLLLDYHQSSRSGMRTWMRIMSPWLRRIFAGRYDVDLERHVAQSGLRVLQRRTYGADAVTMIVAERV
jgi:ubiquinone/menaquinone biosynthesis C-methylase UbiE